MKNIAFAVITEYRQRVLQERGSYWFHQDNEGLLGRQTSEPLVRNVSSHAKSQSRDMLVVAHQR